MLFSLPQLPQYWKGKAHISLWWWDWLTDIFIFWMDFSRLRSFAKLNQIICSMDFNKPVFCYHTSTGFPRSSKIMENNGKWKNKIQAWKSLEKWKFGKKSWRKSHGILLSHKYLSYFFWGKCLCVHFWHTMTLTVHLAVKYFTWEK